MRLKLLGKGFILVAVPLAFELLFIKVLTDKLNETNALVQKQLRAQIILADVTLLSKSFYDAGLTLNSYAITRSPLYSDRFERTANEVKSRLSEMEKHEASDPAQQALKSLTEDAEKGLSLLRIIKDSFENDPIVLQTSDYNKQIKSVADSLDNKFQNFVLQGQKEGKALAHEREQNLSNLLSVLISGVVLNISIACGVAIYFYRDIASRLKIVSSNASLLAAGQKLHMPVAGRDEVADLDRIFHKMASELEEAHANERAITDNAADVICSLDGKGKFIAVNPASTSVLGYTQEELIGKYYIDLVDSASRETTAKSIELSMTGEAAKFESRLRRKDKYLIDILWSARWSQKEQCLYSVLHDVTEHKQAERLRQEVVTMVSHDLRTPLTTIRHAFEMLSADILGTLTDEGKGVVERADRSAQRMLTLSNDLLDVEKIHSGMLALNIAPANLAHLFEQSRCAVELLADRRSIKIEVEAVEFIVLCDSDRIVQVLINLLSNAIKFSDQSKSINIRARLVRCDNPLPTGQSDVEISVVDFGRGIPEHLQDSIFDRFSQIEKSDSKNRAGTGLGLAICKGLIALHGSSIAVSSQPGQGSRFSFKLPLEQSSLTGS